MIQLSRDYRISPERVPVPGASITEGIGIGDILPPGDLTRLELERVNREEDKTLAYAALGLAGVAAAISGGYRALKHLRKKG